jgi:peptide/nickel transport system ATP-binding protein
MSTQAMSTGAQPVGAGLLLSARSVSVGYHDGGRVKQVLADVDLDLPENMIMGLAGESGCGKSTLALVMAGYRAPGLRMLGGEVRYRGTAISSLRPGALREYWGRRIAYLPQDTSTALNPAIRVGRQLAEVFQLHKGMDRGQAMMAGTEMLERVGIPDPPAAMRRYPHEFSGGQQQRIAIGLAIGPGPDVVILDEPTTGLDVTVQARINELIVSLIRAERMAALYVSHNLALLATICDELRILYAGQIVEAGPASDVYFSGRHPYTRDLVAAVPRHLDDKPLRGIDGTPPPAVVLSSCAFGPRCRMHQDRCDVAVPLTPLSGPAASRSVRCVRAADPDEPRAAAATTVPRPAAAADEAPSSVLSVTGVKVTYARAGQATTALADLSLEVAPGEVVGVVGESGSGKSTLLRAIAGLLVPDTGVLTFSGSELPWRCDKRSREARREIQIVFQNPDASLNPRQTVAALIDHPLHRFLPQLTGSQRRDRIREVLSRLRLAPDLLDRYPAELSGGQRQRVALGRALVADPAVVLCDEITSALDVSVQASILELLAGLRRAQGLAMIFVTHDLGVLRAVADRALVLESGIVREQGQVGRLLTAPQHEYTASLVASIPDPAASLPGASHPAALDRPAPAGHAPASLNGLQPDGER